MGARGGDDVIACGPESICWLGSLPQTSHSPSVDALLLDHALLFCDVLLLDEPPLNMVLFDEPELLAPTEPGT